MRYSLLVMIVLLAGMSACQTASLKGYTKFKSEADVPRISLDDAKKQVDAGSAVIVDVRDHIAYRMEHIAGSISFPVGFTDDKIDALPKDKNLILYCSCHAEHTSAVVGFQLNQKGVANTYALVGGTQAWQAAGYPMEKGDL